MFGTYQEINAQSNPTEGTSSTLFWETVGQTQQSNEPQSTKGRNNQPLFKHENSGKASKIIVDDQKSSQTATDENEHNENYEYSEQQNSKANPFILSSKNSARDTGRHGLKKLIANKDC